VRSQHHRHRTWSYNEISRRYTEVDLNFYEPLESQDAIDKAVHWSLGLPDSFVIAAGDMTLLPKMLEAASRFEKCPSDVEMDAVTDEFDVQTIFA